MDSESFLGGGVQLDRERAEKLMREQKGALATVEEFAAGILRVVETEMEKAIRVISVERGHDPREFTLVAFGGGGPLHACALARALAHSASAGAGVAGCAFRGGDFACRCGARLFAHGDAGRRCDWRARARIFENWNSWAPRSLPPRGLKGAAQRTLDLRYRRQGYELNVEYDPQAPAQSIEAFHRLHAQRYGFCDAARPIEIVNLRLRMVAAGEPYAPRRHGAGCRATAARPAMRSAMCTSMRRFRPTRFYRREKLVPGDRIAGRR